MRIGIFYIKSKNYTKRGDRQNKERNSVDTKEDERVCVPSMNVSVKL